MIMIRRLLNLRLSFVHKDTLEVINEIRQVEVYSRSSVERILNYSVRMFHHQVKNFKRLGEPTAKIRGGCCDICARIGK